MCLSVRTVSHSQKSPMSTHRKAILAITVTGVAAAGAICAIALLLPGPAVQSNVPDEDGLSDLRVTRRPFRPGERVVYELMWNGMPCATFRIRLEQEERDGVQRLAIRYEGRTAEALEWAKSYLIQGVTYVDTETLLPVESSRRTVSGEKEKRYATRFDRAEGIAEAAREKVYKNKTKVKRIPFEQGLDIPSALLLARALQWREGEAKVMEVLHWDKLFAVALTPGGVEHVRVKAGEFQARRVELRVRLLSGTDEERVEEESKYRAMRMWLDGESGLLVKLEAEVSVGLITGELVSVAP